MPMTQFRERPPTKIVLTDDSVESYKPVSLRHSPKAEDQLNDSTGSDQYLEN